MNNFPAWVNIGDGFKCDDDEQAMLAFACEFMCGFDLPKFDIWAASLPDCPHCGVAAECCLKQEMRERRQLALEALSDNSLDAAFRHLEWMLNRQRGDATVQEMLPHAKRGAKVTKGASDGGKSRRKWPQLEGEMQAVIEAIHKEKPDISYEEIKRIAARRHSYPAHALKRYTTNPRSK